jgi:hypothetical protein
VHRGAVIPDRVDGERSEAARRRRQSCSIALYPASSLSEKVSFNRINRKTGNRLKQQNVDSETGEVAPPASAGNRSLNLQPDEPNILLNCQANCPKCSDDKQSRGRTWCQHHTLNLVRSTGDQRAEGRL